MEETGSDLDYNSDSSASTTFSEFAEDPPNKRYKCPYNDCHKSFFRPSKLENHKRTHTGEKPFICDISDCKKSYHRKGLLKKHQDQFHFKNIKYVVCPEEGCGLRLQQNSLQKHILRKHNPLRKWKFKCEECSRVFTTENQLKNHSDTHKTIFKCDICFKEYQSGRLYRRHINRHKKYECLCRQTFYNYNSLRTHKKTCEFTRPACNICNRTFTKKTNLKHHMQTIHLGGAEVFKCTFEGCTKEYSLESSLKNHIKSSHMEKDEDSMRLICCICSVMMKNQMTFWRHIKNVHVRPKRKSDSCRKTRSDKNVPKVPMLTLLTGLEHKVEVEPGSPSFLAEE